MLPLGSLPFETTIKVEKRDTIKEDAPHEYRSRKYDENEEVAIM